MWTSVFDIFKIGLGPSSSHVVGPMVAAALFIQRLASEGMLIATRRVTVTLYGSLSLTCRGHGTDGALLLGLSGTDPATVDPDVAAALVKDIRLQKRLALAGRFPIEFDEVRDLVLETGRRLARHPNAMTFAAYDDSATLIDEKTYYSVGGGFVASDQDFHAQSDRSFPFPFNSAASMILQGDANAASISDMARANELCLRQSAEIDSKIEHLITTMMDCIDRGMARTGTLPGGLGLVRRAAGLHQRLQQQRHHNMPGPHEALDWVSLYAIAVNEENAAGGRVVTAPTNGAAGVVPAVLRFYRDFCTAASAAGEHRYILTAGAIGGLFKRNASISGAEVGCQGEVGVACAMAAAGLTAALGGSNRQIENAAEIGMEHHLGMTCDPIAGLVQIPCIERNAMGAVKAVTASSLAMNGDGIHRVSLDAVIKTMMATGRDMSEKYKETSLAGLAVNVPTC